MLVDAATLYYRAFYALPDSITAPDGTPMNAVRGFFDGLRTLRDRYSPDVIVACWDEDWRPQWRVDLLPSYKTHRLATPTDAVAVDVAEEVPDTLAPQVPCIAAICRAAGISVVGAPELEADDVVAALASTHTGPVDIVSGDRDLTQLVDDARGHRLLYLGTGVGTHTVYDEAKVFDTYGVRADQYADFATLRGDASDGIPGAPGIGAKTAAQYLAAFGNLAGVLAAAHEQRAPLTAKKAATLREYEAVLQATQRVVTLQAATLEYTPAVRDETELAQWIERTGQRTALARW